MKRPIDFTKERVLRTGPSNYNERSYLRLQELKIKIADLIIKDVEENKTVTLACVMSIIDLSTDAVAIKGAYNDPETQPK